MALFRSLEKFGRASVKLFMIVVGQLNNICVTHVHKHGLSVHNAQRLTWTYCTYNTLLINDINIIDNH